MESLNATGYALVGLTAIVALLVGVLVLAVLRLIASSRSRSPGGDGRADAVLVSTALEDAIARMKAQERATAARAAATERLSSEIVASLTSGLIVSDGANAVQIVNPAARRILKLAGDDATLDVLLREVPPLRELIAESQRTQAPVLRRTIALDRPGAPMHLGVTVSPLGGSGGAICLFTDLTTVIALEEQLRLKEALARLGELTAGLAHEFRNGLATIHGYGHLLDLESLPPQQRVYVEGIRSETQALGEVVTNFLRFARPDPLTLAPVDLRAVVARAADDVHTAAVTITGDFTFVDGDEVLLRQALSNLFRNSVEACAAAGITPAIHVEGRRQDDERRLVITIGDNGPGIPEDALDRLFQPFFTTRPGGTGLGLAIVLKIVVSHNGTITASNQSAGGARFQVTLPIAHDAA